MNTLKDFLDEAKKVTGSDYATANLLGITRQNISVMRKRGSCENETAVKIAEIIKRNPIEIIAACEAAKSPEKAQFWAKFSAAFFCAFALILSGASNEINALESKTYNQNQAANKLNQTIYYTYCCRLPIADCRLPIADCRLPIADCRLPIADCRLPIADCRLPIADCRLLEDVNKWPQSHCMLVRAAFFLSANYTLNGICALKTPALCFTRNRHESRP